MMGADVGAEREDFYTGGDPCLQSLAHANRPMRRICDALSPRTLALVSGGVVPSSLSHAIII